MRLMIWSAALVVAMGSAASAQEDAKKEAIQAWDDYQKIQAEYNKVRAKAFKDYQAFLKDKGDVAEARKRFFAAISKTSKQLNKAREQFSEAFVKSDWDSWDEKEHAELLEAGLPAAARHATEEGKLDLALKTHQSFVAKFPKSSQLPNIQLNIGDLFAVKGDVETARAKYKELTEHDSDYIKSNAKQRLQLFAKPAPNIDSKEWLGAKAKSLANLKGKVVVIDFWATWCGPCRVVMPGLSKLYEKHKKDGLVVMGLTRFYANGYLPASPDQMLTGGESVKGMDEKSFLEHVKAFRDNTKIAYPFVIGDAANFKAYLVRGIPTVAVVGVDGNVALLAVGSGSEPLVRAIVERELKKIK